MTATPITTDEKLELGPPADAEGCGSGGGQRTG